MNSRFWIGVVSKDNVEKAIKLGICQFCHGKIHPVKRLTKGDFIIYYSSKISINSIKPYQKFTAIGEIIDDTPYQVNMENGFQPYRRNAKYFNSQHVEIKNLIPNLQFIKNKNSWGLTFRSGFLEIDKHSFEIIANQMLNEKISLVKKGSIY